MQEGEKTKAAKKLPFDFQIIANLKFMKDALRRDSSLDRLKSPQQRL